MELTIKKMGARNECWISNEKGSGNGQLRTELDVGLKKVNNWSDDSQIKTNERLNRIEVNLTSLMD